MDYELKQSYLPTAGLYQQYPQSTMVYFQFVFCAITLILIAGSYLCRMNFFAWMLFVPLVSTSHWFLANTVVLMHGPVDDFLVYCWRL
jgi:ammonia channel protein AmtB